MSTSWSITLILFTFIIYKVIVLLITPLAPHTTTKVVIKPPKQATEYPVNSMERDYSEAEAYIALRQADLRNYFDSGNYHNDQRVRNCRNSNRINFCKYYDRETKLLTSDVPCKNKHNINVYGKNKSFVKEDGTIQIDQDDFVIVPYEHCWLECKEYSFDLSDEGRRLKRPPYEEK